MLQDGVLCLDKRRLFERVRDLQYKLFPSAIRYQKVLIALAGQLARGALNSKVLGNDRRGRFGIERGRRQGYNPEVS